MNTSIGNFSLKTYSIVAPSPEVSAKMAIAISEAAKFPMEIAYSVAKKNSDLSEIQNSAIRLIDEEKLENQLFHINGSAERVILNLEKRLIEITSW